MIFNIPKKSKGQIVAEKLYKFKYIIAVALVAILITGSAISVTTAYTPSNNVAIYNKNSGVADYTYMIFSDGTNVYAKNGTSGAITYSGTDASTVINSALSDINKLTGGTIYVKGYGTSQPYQIKSALIIPDSGHLTFYGDGPEYTVFQIPSGFDNNLFQITGAKSSNAFFNEFRDFEGIGNKGTGGVTNSGIVLNGTTFGVTDTVIYNIFLRDFAQDDIYINGPNSWNVRVESTTIEHAGRAGLYRVGGNTASDLRVTNTKFLYNDQYGVYDSGYFATYTSNWFYKNHGYGMWLTDTFTKGVIVANRFEDNGDKANNTYDDIHLFQSDYNVINDNVLFGAEGATNFTRYGIYVDSFASQNLINANNFANGNFGTGKVFIGTSTQTSVVTNNAGYNPVGVVASPFVATQNIFSPMGGAVSTPAASTDYTVRIAPVFITSSGGTGVSITIKDAAGTTVASGLTTLSGQFVPVGYKVNWGAYSGAPTVTVGFN